MSWREFLHWQAYLQIENPEQGDNVRCASLMAQITNMSGKSLSDKKWMSAEDFLGGGKTQGQSMQDQINFMKGLGN